MFRGLPDLGDPREYPAHKDLKGPEENEGYKGHKAPKGNRDAPVQLDPVAWLESKDPRDPREFGVIWGPKAIKGL